MVVVSCIQGGFMRYIIGLLKILLLGLLPHIVQRFYIYLTFVFNVNNNSEALQNIGYVDKLMSSQLPAIIIVSGITIIVLFYVITLGEKKQNLFTTYRFNNIKNEYLGYIISLGILTCLYSIGFSGLIDLTKYSNNTLISFDILTTNKSVILSLISVGIICPIYEEIIFRGAISKNLSGHISGTMVVVIQALLFSAYHFNILQAIPALALGLVTGFAVYYTGSIISGIIIHIINNVIMVLLSQFMPESGVYNSFIFFILMVISGVAMIYTVDKLNNSRESKKAKAFQNQPNMVFTSERKV